MGSEKILNINTEKIYPVFDLQKLDTLPGQEKSELLNNFSY